MKKQYSHIVIVFMILGGFVTTLMGVSYYSSAQILTESELETSFQEISEINLEQETSNSFSDGDGPAAYVATNTFHENDFRAVAKSYSNTGKEISARSPLYIVYCCLKLDC